MIMADKSKDELAKALEALSEGRVEEPRVVTRAASPLAAPPPKIKTQDDIMAEAAEEAMSHPAPLPHQESTVKAAIHGLERIQTKTKFKQTIIPPLLTMSALLIGLGALTLIQGEDSMFEDQTLLKCLLLGFGVILAAAAAVTMLSVKQLLAQQPAK